MRTQSSGQPCVNSFQKPLFILLAVVFIINLLCMPKEMYRGDPMAIRHATSNFIENLEFNIPTHIVKNQDLQGKYFFYNKEKDAWYSKWGIGCTFIYLPPLIFHKLFFDAGAPGTISESLIVILNLYNILFSLLITCYLYMILSFFSKNIFSKCFYVLAAFYSTFLWNYFRAQTTEIYQLFFFFGFIYHYLAFFSEQKIGRKNLTASKASNHLLLSTIFILLATLMKIIFVLLIPLSCLGVLMHYYFNEGNKSNFISQFWNEHGPFYVKFLLIPMAIISLVILSIQNYKFGSPFETGYGQWEDTGKANFAGSIFTGIAGYLFDPQWSIFLNYPILFFSFFGIKRFFKSYRFETCFFISIFLLFLLVTSKLPFWKGEWCYGPRFLLFILPVLSIPFLTFLDYLLENLKKVKAVLLIVVSMVLLWTCVLQVYVNSLPFFVFYEVQGLYEPLKGSKVDNYFKKKPYGVVNMDLVSFVKRGVPFVGVQEVQVRYDQEALNKYNKYIRMLVQSNYYWFPNQIPL